MLKAKSARKVQDNSLSSRKPDSPRRPVSASDREGEREKKKKEEEARKQGKDGEDGEGWYIRMNGRKLILISGAVHCALFVKWKWSRR